MVRITKDVVQPANDWAHPLGLMSDCHRRVERFLFVMAHIAQEANGGELSEIQREGLDKALRYFRQAAPLHTADEEESLFPRMRAAASPEVTAAFAQIDALEADHRVVNPMHDEVDRLGTAWLEAGTLSDGDAQRLIQLATGLQSAYAKHIETEDTVIFPLAGRVLDEATLAQVGREMAERRDVDPADPISRCAARRIAREAGG